MYIDITVPGIINDANKYANGLISEANKKAETIIQQAGKEAAAIKERMVEQGAKDAVVLKHKKHASAELEAHKMRLAARQKAVSTAIEAAIDHLVNMAPDAYISFLAGKIAEIKVREGQLLLNENDRSAIGEELVKVANELLKDGKLTLSDQTINAKGGFVLKYGAIEINSSLETMVNSIKEAVMPELVAVLFREH